jgi:hypothetical protein
MIAVVGLWFTAMLIFKRARKNSRSRHEAVEFKVALPGWVKIFELFTNAVFLASISYFSFRVFFGIYKLGHQGYLPGGPLSLAEFLTVFSSLLAAIAPSMLAANLVSWIIPQVRQANQIAMNGFPSVSFWKVNRELIFAVLVIDSVCILQAVIAAWEPWK